MTERYFPHVEIKWAVRIGKLPKNPPYFALSIDGKGPQLYDFRKDALAARGKYGVVVKVKVREFR